jgi:TolB protein
MLPAGQTGARSAIPWSLVGPGWTLASFDTGRNGVGGDTETLYLVDPAGGRYRAWRWVGTGTDFTAQLPVLVAWSGDGSTALLLDFEEDGNPTGYTEISLKTGQVTAPSLPSVAGFTRPGGTNILAIGAAGSLGQKFLLQRYSLSGALQETLSSLGNRNSRNDTYPWLQCQGCSAISSPDGTSVVWSDGTGLRLISNAGGLIRDLPVPGYARQPSCAAVRWWDPQTILAACYTDTSTSGSDRLWLVPADGGAPVALTPQSGSAVVSGYYTGAWQLSGQTYIAQTGFSSDCPQGAGGPEPVSLFRANTGGALTRVTLPDNAGQLGAVLGASQDELLVLAETSCSGRGTLLSFDPATGATRELMAAGSQAGAVQAIPFGG